MSKSTGHYPSTPTRCAALVWVEEPHFEHICLEGPLLQHAARTWQVLMMQCESHKAAAASYAQDGCARWLLESACSHDCHLSGVRTSGRPFVAMLPHPPPLVIHGLALPCILTSAAWRPMRRDLDVVEVWAGCASVVQAAQRRGLRAEPFDLVNGPAQDILTAEGFAAAIRLVMRIRPGGLLAMGPVCSSFVFANSSNTKRKRDQLQGDISYRPVRDGNTMALMAAFLFQVAVSRDVRTSLENPVSSMMFSFLLPYLGHLGALPFVIVDRCAFSDEPDGDRCKKPYKFLASGSVPQLHFEPVGT